MVQFPRWQMILVLLVLLTGLAFAAPNLFEEETTADLPSWLPGNQVNLGLDLQGGTYLLLEADLEAVMQDNRDDLVGGIRDALRGGGQRIGYRDLGVFGEEVGFTLIDPSLADEVRDRLEELTFGMLVTASGEGVFRIAMTPQQERDLRTDILTRAVEILGIRVNELGLTEPSIQRQGEDRIVVQLPGVDAERAKEIIGQTAKLTFHFVEEGIAPGIDRIPAGAEVLPASEAEQTQGPTSYVVRKRVMVSGENLVDAQPSFQDGQPVVSFRFDTVGAKRFGAATQENVGRLFAIVLDGKVISAPVIREPILGGNGQISGNFTVEEVQDLSLLLRAGALPVPLTFLEERSVGPGLGADSIRAGQIASILGLVFVIIFMAVSYGSFGLMANVALLANLALILGALSGLQATLTLPGIAGIVLTIGMAVDANVLIFERIREETRNGRGPVTAIDAGYRRAITTIIDSNLTTLIAALLLFIFGSGPIKGFAVTLSIGLMTSMFTAIMLTRLLVVTWLRRRRPQALPI